MKKPIEDPTDLQNTEENAPVVLVIGDPMYDVYYKCEVKGLSAEVPIPKLGCDEENIINLPGGAANVMINLRRLDMNAFLVFDPSAHRPTKNRIMVGNHQVCRVDVGDYCDSISSKYVKSSLETYNPQAIVISDYNKGAITSSTIKTVSDYIKDNKEVKLYIDTKSNPSKYPDNATFTPNYEEFSRFPREFTLKERVLLKRGAEGLQLLENGELISSYEPVPVTPVCVNGAGDSVLAAFVSAELKDLNNPGYYANVAGAVAVSTSFTATVTHEKIMQLCDAIKEWGIAE